MEYGATAGMRKSQLDDLTIEYRDGTTEAVVVTSLQIHDSGALIYTEADQVGVSPRTVIRAAGTWDSVYTQAKS